MSRLDASQRVLRTTNLGVERGGRSIISGIDLTLAGGLVTAVVGPNGAGKSTLLAALAGALPCAGEVVLDNAADASADSPAARSDKSGPAPASWRVGYMPQAQTLRTRLTVLEVLLLGRREQLGWRVSDKDLAMAREMVAHFRLDAISDRPMTRLSGGQQQMVLLAQRLMREPDLLVLDEPTSALDLHHQLAVLDLIRDYARRTGAVVVAAIHDLGLATRNCDRVALVDGGTVRSFGAPEEVLTRGMVGEVYRVELETYRNAEGRSVNVPVAAVLAPMGSVSKSRG
ncbi:ABC transporter ATP-binding protein [Rhodobacterales bacterium]|nr:ABC transporter ATP-binding protein [Rhodobacterales bacterium]